MKSAVLCLSLLLPVVYVWAEPSPDPKDLIDAMRMEQYHPVPCPAPDNCVCGQEAFDAEYQLVSMGTDAFWELLECTGDPGQSCQTSRVQGRYDDSIGALCTSLLVRHLEGASLAATDENIGLSAVGEEHEIFASLPAEMVAGWVRQHIDLPLREIQIAAARYAIDLSLSEGRICTARVWRDRLKMLNADRSPEVDPKEGDRGPYNNAVFAYDPRTVLDLIWNGKIEIIRAEYSFDNRPGGVVKIYTIQHGEKPGRVAFYNWLDSHLQALNDPASGSAPAQEGPDLPDALPDTGKKDPVSVFEVKLSCGLDSGGRMLWDPFLTLVLPREGVDMDQLLAVFAPYEQGAF